MRRASCRTLFLVVAACWIAAGPGGRTIQALLACRHHAAHRFHGHHSMPADGPCFCDEMTDGVDLVVSPAVPAPLPADPVVLTPVAAPSYPSRFPLPPSPSFAPTPPPPDLLG